MAAIVAGRSSQNLLANFITLNHSKYSLQLHVYYLHFCQTADATAGFAKYIHYITFFEERSAYIGGGSAAHRCCGASAAVTSTPHSALLLYCCSLCVRVYYCRVWLIGFSSNRPLGGRRKIKIRRAEQDKHQVYEGTYPHSIKR